MDWETFVSGARAVSWITYVATCDSEGRPHVAPVAPGFTDGTIWFATRSSSHKFANLVANREVAFHWPVGSGEGPGELFARATATVFTELEDRRRLWTEANLSYDPSHFFGSPDNADLAFVECTVTTASILGPDFTRSFYQPG